jgi:hypothetical protein
LIFRDVQQRAITTEARAAAAENEAKSRALSIEKFKTYDRQMQDRVSPSNAP